MFEDSTFESTGRIKTRSRRWMLATLVFNASILVVLVLVPIIYPAALPHHAMTSLLVAPTAPQPEPPTVVQVRAAKPREFSEMVGGSLIAPPRIPKGLPMVHDDGPLAATNIAAIDLQGAVPGGDGKNIFAGQHPVVVVHPPAPAPLRLPSNLVEGLLIYKNVPQYPIIPKTMGIQGTVVLQATISRNGVIENLRVVGGPQMLQQAALDAVKTWRYRPYLLNGQPVEVETTVSVIFKLER